mgnify:CR=1 FL=1
MWIIEKDLIPIEGLKSRVGIGSANYDKEKFAKAETVPFRLLDDDGEVYYEGRMTAKRLNSSGELAFEPLDWAMGDAGCTELQYREGGGPWTTL